MNHSILWKVIIGPLFGQLQDLLLILCVEIVVFTWKFIWFVTTNLTPAIFTIIIAWITATNIKIIIRLLILTTEQNPTCIKENIYMKLSFALDFFNIRSVNANYISNTFNLWAIFNSLGAKNAIEDITWLYCLIPLSVITMINDFQSHDVSIAFLLVKRHSCINNNRINVNRVLIILEFINRSVLKFLIKSWFWLTLRRVYSGLLFGLGGLF
jgi:hypothetical protein